MDKGEAQYFIATSIVLFVFWTVLSSATDIQHVILGLLCAVGVSYYSSDLIKGGSSKLPKIGIVPAYFKYLGRLLVEIVLANIHVARIVLSPSLPIKPSIVKFNTALKSETGKVSLANSITLTPGTLTLDIIGDTFYVHALTQDAADEVTHWHMEKKLKEVEDAS